MSNTLLDNLNDQQLKAIIYNEGPSVIIAGAGTGKTRVLTHKIAYLIKTLNVNSDRILALTFTNKAAKEMKHRLEKLLDDNSLKTNLYTYHALGAKILRSDISLLGFNNNFNIIDIADQRSILRDIYKDSFDEKATVAELKLLVLYISKWKNEKTTKEEVAEDYYNDLVWIRRFKIYEKYQIYQKENNCLDFDDLLLFMEELFEKFPQTLEKWQKKYDYILVDEFQDTNDLQYKILLNLAYHNNLTLVGDPDQTIYTWRGANTSLISNFAKKFPKTQQFILNENYRSTSKILNTANSLIHNNRDRIPKDLFTKNGDGEDITVFQAQNSTQEANWVANIIKKLKVKQNIKENQIAILYRNNYLSRDIEQSLINQNLSYRTIGGLKFYERKEIKDVIAYLKLITWKDNLSLRRILLNTPKIGVKTIDQLFIDAQNQNLNLSDYLVKFEHNIKNNLKVVLKPLIEFIGHFQNEVPEVTSLYEFTNEILNKIQYIEQLKRDFEHDRIDNIEQLLSQIIEFDAKHEDKNGEDILVLFLQEVSLYTDQDDENKTNAINLMTVHSAKGLEFDFVFIVGINEGVLPGTFAKSSNITEKYKEKLEEERRVFYVAITRAKKYLFLSSAGGYSLVLKEEKEPSRFFKELDMTNLKVINNEHQEVRDDIYQRQFKINNSVGKTETKSQLNPWKVHDIIVHDIFGKGVITKIIGDKIEVAFHKSHGGIKILSAYHPSIKKYL